MIQFALISALFVSFVILSILLYSFILGVTGSSKGMNELEYTKNKKTHA